MKSIEFFTGAGGLALGTSMAGFEHTAVVEFDHDCCETLRLNQRLGNEPIKHWRIIEGDVRGLDHAGLGPVELIAGGVPCQPFDRTTLRIPLNLKGKRPLRFEVWDIASNGEEEEYDDD